MEAEKVVIVPNGIDTGYFVHDRLARDGLRSGLNVKSEFLWITVGRFVEEKDHGALIRALTVVRNSVPQTRLLIVGDGPLTGKIKALVAERNLQDAVILAGSVRDVRPLLSAADGFVLSSEREGLPLALLEAMSMALPVASTNVGSIPDVIADGHGGILVEPRSAEALAAAMLAVQRLSTPDRKAMGAEGRKTVVSRFSVGVIADQWVDIYEQCLTSPRPASLRHH